MCYVYDNRYSLSPKTVETWIMYEYKSNEPLYEMTGFVVRLAGIMLSATGVIIAVLIPIAKLVRKSESRAVQQTP